MTLGVDGSGRLYAKNQVTDYELRGDGFASFNVIDYFVDTYEAKYVPGSSGTGRPSNKRTQYRDPHPRRDLKSRTRRGAGHNNLPNFIGQYFPRRDDVDVREFYCASMLVLLKPWTDMNVDLKSMDDTWEEAFERFIIEAPGRILNIIDGIQFFHECESAAAARREDENVTQRFPGTANDQVDEDDMEDVEEDGAAYPHDEEEQEEELEYLKHMVMSEKNEVYAWEAVQIAKFSGFFDPSCDNENWIVEHGGAERPTGGDLRNKSEMFVSGIPTLRLSLCLRRRMTRTC